MTDKPARDDVMWQALALLGAAPTMYRACCAAYQALNSRTRSEHLDADALSLLRRVRRETEPFDWCGEHDQPRGT